MRDTNPQKHIWTERHPDKNQHTRDQRDFENPYFNTTFENNSIALFNEMFAYFGITRGLSENCDGFSFLNPFSTQKRD